MKHIILIGFKHVGKSAVGRSLAQVLNLKHLDLDKEIEIVQRNETGLDLPCRQIMLKHGELFFRDLESKVLTKILETDEQMVLSVGGGTPLKEENRKAMDGQLVIHVSAPRSVVYERIMLNGRPAFFPDSEEPLISFLRLWEEREKIFQGMAHCTVHNNGPLEQVVENIKKILSLKQTKEV